MTDAQKAHVLAAVSRLLDQDTARFSIVCPSRAVEVAGRQRYEPGPTTYVLLMVGPVDEARENALAEVLDI